MTDLNTVHEHRLHEDRLHEHTAHERLDQARDHLRAAERVLTARVPGLAELHGAVDGAIQVTTALADLVATVLHRAPASLEHSSRQVLNELLADLRAMHGCLTTGPLLLAPARDDLHDLLTRRRPSAGGQQPSDVSEDQQAAIGLRQCVASAASDGQGPESGPPVAG